MNRVNPKFVLRNHLAQTAIEKAQAGDFGEVSRLLTILEHPFDEQPEHAAYADFHPRGHNRSKSPAPPDHDQTPRPRRSALRGEEERCRVAGPARPDAVRGGTPRRHRTRLHRQVLDHTEAGKYLCVGCGTPLFDSSTKFDAGCGWPSYFEPINSEVVERVVDQSHGMVRVEVRCNRCGSHLGHVFEDGPEPTGERFCINSAAIDFKPRA